MAKYDFKKIYEDRIQEIDRQIKIEIRKKHWGMKNNLENERSRLKKILEEG